ncbi:MULTISPECIES: NAD(P)-binding domain-containing protein [Priestia]|uniref:NAD(P)-binding domain-containing protein n=1 Tax=Priestia TaxID=2800373 RepID=UPI001C2F49AD|nr:MULTISPECIES: NAD(P)/FAD-dependent oxidoreductase [Priestia]MBX9993911.1 NAD(P)/FAD-dependent oxidoreductase [Priestia aryabhattai]MCP1451244.1 cation diffusion facilitator CzcD-associated flavoprotein CzcO [Priestia megaterium]MED4047970.1 NAD(P)/FAD-dependent oxidoreductase [Priestia megaterium]MED4059382.1 NAD(P)/FAD-dependent oxidoreductase [Priestia megaterium]WJD82715.1 NAD(P)/FAD-dependent oxidoreductase [Priestia megaterium]
MSLEALNKRVETDLSYLSFRKPTEAQPITPKSGHVYDVIIIGGGQSGLGTAFGLLRERVSNILVIDENRSGLEGPWETYARMITLRTPKNLTSVDLGMPSLTFQAWWEAQFGSEGWEALDKIPRGDWMNYLRWYRNILNLPVANEIKLTLIEPAETGIHRLHIEGNGAVCPTLMARKVILATGIQGGGEWHVPPMISEKLPPHLYSHTSQTIDFTTLKNKKVAVLGGGASAFDNANYALSEGVAEAHVFVRRKELPRINPIRQMEASGMIERFHALSDAEKYEVMAHFFEYNQPPTNDTFGRASSWPGFHLHVHAPWLDVEEKHDKAVVTTPQGTFTFDYLIISTGLLTDPALRPELQLVEKHIARWNDHYKAPHEIANPVLDAHPYLSNGFAFLSRNREGQKMVYGLFAFNYSALISCGISASALSGLKYAIPKLVSEVANQLFIDNRHENLTNFFDYDEPEFVGSWSKDNNQVKTI